MRLLLLLVFSLVIVGCSASHVVDPRCDALACGPAETCCLTCTGLACVPAGTPCGCPTEDGGTAGSCGGPSAIGCGPREVCDASSCGAYGACVARPTACADIYDPVCGCDRVDYGNPCEASAAGAVVASRGPCGPSSACGTRGAPPCPAGTFCDLEACGVDDRGGSCVAFPAGCENIYAPVCGCDGVSYANACESASVGSSVRYAGECATGSCEAEDVMVIDPSCDEAGIHWNGSDCASWSGCCVGTGCGAGWISIEQCRAAHRRCDRYCGGWVGPTCLPDEYCDFSSDGCDWADASGLCRPRPTECLEPGGVPVCGCNGMDYDNECAAHLDGTDAAHYGGCPIPG